METTEIVSMKSNVGDMVIAAKRYMRRGVPYLLCVDSGRMELRGFDVRGELFEVRYFYISDRKEVRRMAYVYDKFSVQYIRTEVLKILAEEVSGK